MKLKSISNLMGLLLTVVIVVGASIFVSWVVMGTLGLFRETTTLTVIGGEAFVDPTDAYTVVGEVMVSIIGPDRVHIIGVKAVYRGEEYSTNCLNCNTIITESYPNSANDIVSLKFYFRSNSRPSIGDSIEVIVKYGVTGEEKYASGTITISS